ncbi:hypothetical protein GH714_037525 [Hevea brasiliensis]|uniref:Uncharacterized protein n=1 Tax=Hevea brasiliensis TaxID=3981 RepID=A0A6A6K899_HEVBR|nr:hypothetical protein GH714_037525 [Hevea brasiliensis]
MNGDRDRVQVRSGGSSILRQQQLNDDEYTIEASNEDVSNVLVDMNVNENQNPIKKGRLIGSRPQNPSIEGIGNFMMFEGNDTYSNYGASDELHFESDSDGEGYIRCPEFNMERDIRDPSFKVGMVFSNRDEFREACEAHSINHRYEIFFPENDLHRVQARCKVKDCKWKIWVCKLNSKEPIDHTMRIKTGCFGHNYGKSFKNYHMTSKRLARHYLEACRNDPTWSLSGLITKGIYGGQLLLAVGIEPNDCIFPLAWAVVPSAENTDSWQWFMEQLRNDLQMYSGHYWAFMSNRQKGLVNVIGQMFPNS